MTRKPAVWYVDDQPKNLSRFQQAHGDAFDLRLFSSPIDVLQALSESSPDAVLCDLFFADSPELGARIEERLAPEEEHLADLANEVRKSGHLAGLELIERIMARSPDYPVYAYSSKPYLLQSPDFERIARASARLLIKGGYGVAVEQMILAGDIEKAREGRGVRGFFRRNLLPALAITNFVSIVLGITMQMAIDAI